MQDASDFDSAVDILIGLDTDLRGVVEAFGRPEFWTRPNGFETIVLFVLEQQVSLASAAATLKRLADTIGSVDPNTILETGEARIRSAGVTRQKSGYLIGLAEATARGELDFDRLAALDDDAVRRHLVALRGIGPWTADVYLLSCLRRPDIWPVGDRALQVGVAELLDLADPPSPEMLGQIGDRWRPHRSTAARLVWHRYLSVRGRG
ncbi:MAG: DNA-3-methyladenine glycosylase 2 family protein [Acidimicrobiia bacterium]|nr:DNA-3-methyladenine glycosylase 2 family protein [Acidimicrobiia bacterium]